MKNEETRKLLEISIDLFENIITEINSKKHNSNGNYPYPYNDNLYTIDRKDKFRLLFGILVFIILACSFILLLFIS